MKVQGPDHHIFALEKIDELTAVVRVRNAGRVFISVVFSCLSLRLSSPLYLEFTPASVPVPFTLGYGCHVDND